MLGWGGVGWGGGCQSNDNYSHSCQQCNGNRNDDDAKTNVIGVAVIQQAEERNGRYVTGPILGYEEIVVSLIKASIMILDHPELVTEFK